MPPDVHRAIEGLYTAFAAAKRPSDIPMSPVKDPADFASLLITPLRELTAEHLWQYSFSLFNTVGDTPDFEYFFPRIIELATDPFSRLEIEVVFQKPAMTGWPSEWRKERRKAFQAYLEAVIASWATTFCEIDKWVCALSFCLPDLDRRLKVLMSGSDAANKNLMDFHEANRESLKKNRLSNAFWDHSTATHTLIVAWLQRPELEHRIQLLHEANLQPTNG